MRKTCYYIIGLMLCLAASSGCQRERWNDNGQLQDVNVRLVLNVSTNPQTKQSGTDTQSAGTTFSGLTDGKLLAYAQSEEKEGKILAVESTASKVFDLSVLASGTENSRQIFTLSIPLKTNTMLFYGRGVRGGADASFSADDRFGKLDKDGTKVDGAPGITNFKLAKRLEDATRFETTKKLLAGILTFITNTGIEAGTLSGYTDGSYPAVNWKAYDGTKSPVTPAQDLYPLEEVLKNVYHQLVTLGTGELRNGSGEGVLQIVTDLWSVLNGIKYADPVSKEDAVAKLMGEAITTRIRSYFTATTIPTDGSAVSGVHYKKLSSIITAFEADENWPSTAASDAYKPADASLEALLGNSETKADSVSIADFPLGFNLPRGVSCMSFDATNSSFYYPRTFTTSDANGMPVPVVGTSSGGATEYNAESYFYPPQILYYGNSPIRASDKEKKLADYPAVGYDWINSTKWDTWTGTHIESTTRSVAMKYEINYGVAMLETKVGYDNTASLNDNNGQTVTVDASSFKFTGIIIGGQPQNVGWNCLPRMVNSKMATGFVYDRAVYDQSIPQYSAERHTTDPNYTVVFDNYNANSTGGKQDKVYVALEFQNCTGKAFQGYANQVPNGGYFYLIGLLDPASVSASSIISWPTDEGHVIPPYKADGTSQKVTRVFVQDFITSATFRIGENSLKQAYLTVPDLRASSVTVGLAVNLNWRTGLQYGDIIIGGK